MAINQDIIKASWEGQLKSSIEAGLKALLQRMLEVLEGPLAANSVGNDQLTQTLRDAINSIDSKVPNTRTVNSKALSENITIGPGDIMVGGQTLADKLEDIENGGGSQDSGDANNQDVDNACDEILNSEVSGDQSGNIVIISGIYTRDNNSADLEFSDEEGNILMRLANGHIETANFDSSNLASGVSLDNYYTKSEVNSLIGGGSSIPSSPLKILVIGNSYSCDSFSYLPFILKDSFGINIELGVYYRGGATTDDFVEKYTERNYDDVYYSIKTATQSSWSTSSSHTPHTAVTSDTWDMIVLQQGSGSSYDISNYASVQALYNLIKADAQYDFVLGWNINHIRVNQFGSNNENWQNVLDCCKLQPSTFVFPYGTAIFNVMEKYKDIPSTGAYLMYNNHLNEGLPCYLAAIANIQAIFDRYYPGMSVLGDAFVPNTTQRMGGAQAHGNMYSMLADQRYVCQCAAILANKDKFNVNPIS